MSDTKSAPLKIGMPWLVAVAINKIIAGHPFKEVTSHLNAHELVVFEKTVKNALAATWKWEE